MIDTQRITDAIIATGCSPLSLEEGAQLVENWANTWQESDSEETILAVECGWSVRLDEYTWAIGVMDMISRDSVGIHGNEWKSTKEPGRYWNEDKWLESIKTGPQIGVYALALRNGEFYSGGTPQHYGVEYPVRIRVRAGVKTPSPIFWPTDPADGWQEFGAKSLEAITNAFRVKAAAIRQARREGLVPWQFPGRQCNDWNRKCEYWDVCTEFRSPGVVRGFDGDDPAAKLALPFLPVEARHEDAVILSASAYQDYSACMEKGRLNAQGGGKEVSSALETGTCLHAGLASLYQQIMETQRITLTPSRS